MAGPAAMADGGHAAGAPLAAGSTEVTGHGHAEPRRSNRVADRLARKEALAVSSDGPSGGGGASAAWLRSAASEKSSSAAGAGGASSGRSLGRGSRMPLIHGVRSWKCDHNMEAGWSAASSSRPKASSRSSKESPLLSSTAAATSPRLSAQSLPEPATPAAAEPSPPRAEVKKEPASNTGSPHLAPADRPPSAYSGDSVLKPTESVVQAANWLSHADVLIIGDSTGIEIRRPVKEWPGLRVCGIAAEQLCSPSWFRKEPRLAWAFWAHRYREHMERSQQRAGGVPAPQRKGEGKCQAALHRWADQVPLGSFVITSDIEGRWQRGGWPSDKIMEIHGTLRLLQCSKPCCNDVWPAPIEKICGLVEDKMTHRIVSAIPCCPRCGEAARPAAMLQTNVIEEMPFCLDALKDQACGFQTWLDSLEERVDHVYINIVCVQFGASFAGDVAMGEAPSDGSPLNSTADQVISGEIESIVGRFPGARLIRVVPPEMKDKVTAPLKAEFGDKWVDLVVDAGKVVNQLDWLLSLQQSTTFILRDHVGFAAAVRAPMSTSVLKLLHLLEHSGIEINFTDNQQEVGMGDAVAMRDPFAAFQSQWETPEFFPVLASMPPKFFYRLEHEGKEALEYDLMACLQIFNVWFRGENCRFVESEVSWCNRLLTDLCLEMNTAAYQEKAREQLDRKGLTDLCWGVREAVLPLYGLSADNDGLRHLMTKIWAYGQCDPDILKLAEETMNLSYMRLGSVCGMPWDAGDAAKDGDTFKVSFKSEKDEENEEDSKVAAEEVDVKVEEEEKEAEANVPEKPWAPTEVFKVGMEVLVLGSLKFHSGKRLFPGDRGIVTEVPGTEPDEVCLVDVPEMRGQDAFTFGPGPGIVTEVCREAEAKANIERENMLLRARPRRGSGAGKLAAQLGHSQATSSGRLRSQDAAGGGRGGGLAPPPTPPLVPPSPMSEAGAAEGGRDDDEGADEGGDARASLPAAKPSAPDASDLVERLTITHSSDTVLFEKRVLREGATCWTDRDYRYTRIPPELVGASFFASRHRGMESGTITVRTRKPGMVYVWTDFCVQKKARVLIDWEQMGQMRWNAPLGTPNGTMLVNHSQISAGGRLDFQVQAGWIGGVAFKAFSVSRMDAAAARASRQFAAHAPPAPHPLSAVAAGVSRTMSPPRTRAQKRGRDQAAEAEQTGKASSKR
eukprot:TRINITY_DN41213_c0_g1_i1.p1 TRINITY_DN41213_c0_g1~~TRINITY_DN41213_c0_g1_i1.p1  ORF type:complete len:1183 (+),score=300.86 TRINITY_DN41213_c0_g1_i1:41-3589(+)